MLGGRGDAVIRGGRRPTSGSQTNGKWLSTGIRGLNLGSRTHRHSESLFTRFQMLALSKLLGVDQGKTRGFARPAGNQQRGS